MTGQYILPASVRSIADGISALTRASNARLVRGRVADVDTALHPDAALELLGHAHARVIVALSLERNTTRRDAAQAAANSQRPEVPWMPKAFLVEAGTSPRNKQTANSATQGAPSPKGDGGTGKNGTNGFTELACIRE